MNIGSGGINAVNQAERVVDSNVFIPKIHSLPFLVRCISGSRLPVLFLVELVAGIMVASTMLPSRNIRPFFSRCLFTSLSSAFPRQCNSRKCRKLRMVVSSGK